MRRLKNETEVERWERLLACAKRAFAEVDRDELVGSSLWHHRYMRQINAAINLAKAKNDCL